MFSVACSIARAFALDASRHNHHYRLWPEVFVTCSSRQPSITAILRANAQLLSKRDRQTVQTLINTRHGYIFKNWPRPGNGTDCSLLRQSSFQCQSTSILCSSCHTAVGIAGLRDRQKLNLVSQARAFSANTISEEELEAARLGAHSTLLLTTFPDLQ